MGNIQTVGPNEALVISGGCFNTNTKMVVGGWAWAWYMVSKTQRLSLEVMTLEPHCEKVETSQGVPLTVTGVAQCKIMTDKKFLTIAAEQFLGKNSTQVESVIMQTMEGHLRAILGTLTVEEIYQDRDQFASLVREVATPDVGRMGIEILSFTIKDVFDHVDYLASLGKARTAEVKRDARIGVALAERDAGIRESECDKLAMDVKFNANTKIENSRRQFEVQKAEFDTDVNKIKAETDLAYELQSAKLQQLIRTEEKEINVIERRKEIDIQEKEVLRKEKELTSTVKLPAEAEAFKIETIAEANKTMKIQGAKAQANKVKSIGSAEAYTMELIGKAEAERMILKANAYKEYEESAILDLTLQALPKVAAEIAKPLAKTDNIVMLGGSTKLTEDISRIAAQLPPTISALTGTDLTKILEKVAG